MGRAFLDSTHMLLAFESYCVNQCSAALLVDQLIQDRDVLRVFLDEIQKERSSLRKMDLKAFLMIPVQRVTKSVHANFACSILISINSIMWPNNTALNFGHLANMQGRIMVPPGPEA